VSETSGQVWNKEDLPLVDKDQLREHLNKLNMYKLMRHDEMHLQRLREMTGVIVRSFLIIFESSWWLADTPEDWK